MGQAESALKNDTEDEKQQPPNWRSSRRLVRPRSPRLSADVGPTKSPTDRAPTDDATM